MRNQLTREVRSYRAPKAPLAARLLVSLATLAFLATGGSAQLLGETLPVKKSTDKTFVSGGQSIKIWRFEPVATGNHPAVIMLHGLDGMEANPKAYEFAAQRLAAQGYGVFLVHYFDRTGTAGKELERFGADIKRGQEGRISPVQHAEIKQHFHDWMATVRDAVAFVRKQAGVDAGRIGLVGFSLGGYLALAVAMQEDLKITAVVEFFGGLPQELREGLTSLPPTLIFHGDKDKVVSVTEAHALRDLLVERKLSSEIHIYQGVGHVFVGDDGAFQFADALNAELRTTAFLNKHLKPIEHVRVDR